MPHDLIAVYLEEVCNATEPNIVTAKEGSCTVEDHGSVVLVPMPEGPFRGVHKILHPVAEYSITAVLDICDV